MNGASEWLQFASEDLEVASLVLEAELYNQVCFHAQQCAEKTLKAWLVHHGQQLPRVHQLGLLLHLCPRPLPFSTGTEALVATLDRFYTLTRYPDAFAAAAHTLPTEDDAEEALNTAREVWEKVNEELSSDE